MLQNAKAAAPTFARGDRVRRNAWFFSHCGKKDAAYYRGRLGTVVGPAERYADSLHDHRIENWIRVRWDGEEGYMVTSVPNLACAGAKTPGEADGPNPLTGSADDGRAT